MRGGDDFVGYAKLPNYRTAADCRLVTVLLVKRYKSNLTRIPEMLEYIENESAVEANADIDGNFISEEL